ncbi:MAG: hypothetical protein Q8L44_14080 [Sulfuritalea sp.]|nr:hypothetical protein [Sulfuritalea sp.]
MNTPHWLDQPSNIRKLWRGFLVVLALLLPFLRGTALLNAAYFLPIVYRAFFRPLSAESEAHPHGEAPLPIVIALTCTAGLTIALFFFPDTTLRLAEGVAGVTRP